VNVTEWTTASIALTGEKGGGQTGGHSRIREITGKLKVGRWRIGAGGEMNAGVVKARQVINGGNDNWQQQQQGWDGNNWNHGS